MSFPKTLYARTGGSVTVEDAAHERALGPGWSENPPAPIDDAEEAEAQAEPDKKKKGR